jgi:hypothetical protein
MKCSYCNNQTNSYQKEWIHSGTYKAYLPVCRYHQSSWYKIHELPSYIPEIQEIAYLRQLEAKDKNNIYLKQTGL